MTLGPFDSGAPYPPSVSLRAPPRPRTHSVSVWNAQGVYFIVVLLWLHDSHELLIERRVKYGRYYATAPLRLRYLSLVTGKKDTPLARRVRCRNVEFFLSAHG